MINKIKELFKRIWKELNRDRIKEIFERGYNLGRKHERDSWEFKIKYHKNEL